MAESKEMPSVRLSARVITIGALEEQIKKQAMEVSGVEQGSRVKPTEETKYNRMLRDGTVIKPPQDLYGLARLPQHNQVLQPLITAMSVNIHGFGYRFESLVKLSTLKDGDSLKNDIAAEKLELKNWFKNCWPEGSFTKLMRRTRDDLEATGNAFWEVIRHDLSGKIQYFKFVPAYQMRLAKLGRQYTAYDRKVPVSNPDGSLKYNTIKDRKRFRRYVQVSENGQRLVWFKEYRDPRFMDYRDGKYDKSTSKRFRATEVIHWGLYSAGTPYGIPRYMGNLVNIYGDRAADEVNFFTLSNNNVPNVVIHVSNGKLTPGTVKRIKEFVRSSARGARNYSRVLLLESAGRDSTGAKIVIEPLTNAQIQDQLWIEYGKNSADRLRISYRMPPIFIGKTETYNRATAETSRKVGNEQIFEPERTDWDDDMDRLVLTDFEVKYHTFKSNSANVTDDKDLIAVMGAGEKAGAMTPRRATMILEDILNQELEPIPTNKLDPDVPMTIQVAEKIKNQAAAQTGGPEIGSQVTALKALQADETLDHLLSIRDRLDEMELENSK